MNRQKIKMYFVRTVAVLLVTILAVLPVSAAGSISSETDWGGSTYVHSVNDGQKVIKKGIDVSSYQGSIDWEAVKNDTAANLSFAFLRLGYSAYTTVEVTQEEQEESTPAEQEESEESTTTGQESLEENTSDISEDTVYIDEAEFVKDTTFEANLSGAKDAGLSAGVYFYTQAITAEEAVAEAEWVLEQLKQENGAYVKLELPVVLDFEYKNNSGRIYEAGLSTDEKTAICTAFCETIKQAGYDTAVYANKSMFTDAGHIDASVLQSKGIKIWLAHYTKQSSYSGNYDFWQCTDKGTVDGISTYVDFDFGYFDATEDDDVTTPGNITSTSASGITISWSTAADADGYAVYRADYYSGTYKRLALVEEGTSYQDTAATANQEYYYKIYPYKLADGTRIFGESSDIVTAVNKTKSDCLVVFADGSTTVNLRSHPGTSSDCKVLARVPVGTVLTWLANTQDSNGKLWYKVSCTVSGVSYTGYFSSAYTKPYVSNMGTVKGSTVSTSSIKLSWSKVAWADGYAIYRADAKNGTYKVIANVTGTSYTNTNLSSGREYYYYVKAYRKSNSQVYYGSKASATIAASTKLDAAYKVKTKEAVNMRKGAGTEFGSALSGSKIPKSTVLKVISTTYDKSGNAWMKVSYYNSSTKKTYTGYVMKKYLSWYVSTVSKTSQNSKALSKSTITVTWSKVAEATGYQIYRSTSPNGTYKKVKTVTGASTLSWKDTKKSAGTEYYYKVRAYKKIGSKTYYGSFSDVAKLHTKMKTTRYVKTTSSVTMRKSAGTSYKSMVKVPSKKKLKVIYYTKDKKGKTWYKVTYKKGTKKYTGYIPAANTKKVK